MMADTSMLTVKLPSALKHRIARIAEERGVSVSWLAIYMFTKEIGQIESEQYLSDFWKGCSESEVLSGFDEVMAKVKNESVPEWDKLDM
ncbi:MAG: ribbon-helix-helix protein, CopG family [Candidatus Electrothrix sp. AUS4]|nr:ribbon-helix-helix protein, CopG family [Candidatus Electrothrix sp. AUS4]